jgi:hypothetical protein
MLTSCPLPCGAGFRLRPYFRGVEAITRLKALLKALSDS